MAKKKRRIGSGLHAPGGADGGVAVAAMVSAKGKHAPPGATPPAGGGDEAEVEVDGGDVALALRAVARLCALQLGAGAAKGAKGDGGEGGGGGGESEALPEALQSLISARAHKYEEDAKAAKLAEAAQGNPANARAGAGGALLHKKKQAPSALVAAPNGAPQLAGFHGDGGGEPLGSKEITEVARVASWLAARPGALASKACKQLRSALHPLVEARLREEKASPAFRVTCALGQRARWPEALRMLADMRSTDAQRRPKLGAYQRWVREVNAAHGEPHELAVLDAIMRVAAGFQPPPGGAASSKLTEIGTLQEIPPWRPACKEQPGAATMSPKLKPGGKKRKSAGGAKGDSAAGAGAGTGAEEEEQMSTVNRLSALVASRRNETAAAAKAAAESFGPGSWTVLAHEEGHQRMPPNRFPLDIYTCTPGALSFSSPPPVPCARHAVPGVEGAFMLTDVLSTAEIDRVRALTEAIGYRPDVPLSSPLDERAQNVVLFANEQQNNALFSRVRDLLPQSVHGDSLVGINRRWRIYRYQEGNAYRKHLDGAWPASGMRTKHDGTKEYVYDMYGGNTRSRFTFIIYLNDDFEGGCTTYFTPKPGVEGTLESRPVRPCAGCATVFPHGDFGLPLLHEGSPVTKGAKYLLRTDVVYASPEASAKMKEAKRLRGLARQLGGLGGKDLAEEAMAGVESGKKKDGVKKKVIKTKMKSNKFREKQEAKQAKDGATGKQEGRGGPMRFNRVGMRPKKNGRSGRKAK